MRGVRLAAALLVLAAGLAGAAAVVALAQPANGLPAYTKGYATWPKLNRATIRGGSSAHAGVKEVYASRRKAGKAFPNGTVVVKTIAARAKARPRQVAVMRKVRGRWQWAEYELAGARYARLALPASVCTSCHVGARANDWVFTRR
jgi:hypothetical protein